VQILATDLDRTLLPNGHWPADAAALPLFNRLTRGCPGLLLVYVTGRSLALTEQAIAHYGIRHPDVLCADVGTTIRHFQQGRWGEDGGWPGAIRGACPRWDADALRDALAGVAGLRLQEPEHQNAFKLSYYTDHARREAILDEVARCEGGSFDATTIYSVDPLTGSGLLDMLPAAATKRTALEYLASRNGLARESVLFCGDSGNDIPALTAGFRGIVVRNADEQLQARLDEARRADPSLQLYFARGDFHGLNGNYASGIIEGCCHYGLFDTTDLE